MSAVTALETSGHLLRWGSREAGTICIFVQFNINFDYIPVCLLNFFLGSIGLDGKSIVEFGFLYHCDRVKKKKAKNNTSRLFARRRGM